MKKSKTVLKILHTTDLHFNKEWFRWIAQQQENYDLFCISGDLLESSADENLLEQVEWVSSWIRRFDKPMFVCSGNHDIEEIQRERWLNEIDAPNYYPDHSLKTIGGITFGCFPFIGAEGYFEYDECDVLITHVPPAKTKTSTDINREDWGDIELRKAIKNRIINPKILLCGHMHRPIANIDTLENTTIYNPGLFRILCQPSIVG